MTGVATSEREAFRQPHRSDDDNIEALLSADFPQARMTRCRLRLPAGANDSLHFPAIRLLNVVLKARYIDPHRPIVFIAHALWGAVVKLALLLATKDSQYHLIAYSTRGLAFLGSQHGEPTNATARYSFTCSNSVETLLSCKRQNDEAESECTTDLKVPPPEEFHRSADSLNLAWLRVYQNRLRVASFDEELKLVSCLEFPPR